MKKKSIMIVDDDRETVELAKEILEKNYNVVTAYSGKECLEKLVKKKVDLVLLDIMMPDMHGRSAYLKIRRKDKKVKVAIFTVLQFPSIYLAKFKLGDSYEIDLKKIGISDFINKPFTPEELTRRVKAILSTPAPRPR